MKKSKPLPDTTPEGGTIFPLDYPKWVPLFLERESAKAERDSKGKQLKETERAKVNKPSFHDNLKTSYEMLQRDRVEFLEEVLRKHQLHPNPLNFLEDLDKYRPAYQLPKLPEFSELLEAAKCLTHGKLSFSEKAKLIARLKKEIENLDAKIAEISSKDERLRDAAGRFVLAWQKKQHAYCEPINPFGISLELSKKHEKDAWESLGISKYLSDNGPNLAYDNPI